MFRLKQLLLPRCSLGTARYMAIRGPGWARQIIGSGDWKTGATSSGSQTPTLVAELIQIYGQEKAGPWMARSGTWDDGMDCSRLSTSSGAKCPLKYLQEQLVRTLGAGRWKQIGKLLISGSHSRGSSVTKQASRRGNAPSSDRGVGDGSGRAPRAHRQAHGRMARAGGRSPFETGLRLGLRGRKETTHRAGRARPCRTALWQPKVNCQPWPIIYCRLQRYLTHCSSESLRHW